MRRRLLRGTIAVVAALAVLYAGGEHRHPSDVVVLQRARVAVSRLANNIGPNTTFHLVVLQHTADPVANGACSKPADVTTEVWAVFGAYGELSSLDEVATDASGNAYSVESFKPPSTLVSTELAPGQTTTLPLRYTPNAATFAESLNYSAFDAAYAAGATRDGAVAVMTRDATGSLTYVLTTTKNREYIDAASYQLVQSDKLAPDGSVTKSDRLSVAEVLSGDVAPVATPISELTPTPCVPPTDPTGQTRAPVVTGDAAVDRVIASAQASDGITLAGLAGYQKIACKTDSVGGTGDPPPCQPAETDGTLVEVLPASDCGTRWVRPEQVTDLFRLSLGAEPPQLLAVFTPKATAALFGGGFDAGQVAVFRTSTHGSGDDAGVALHIRDGRVVWVEADCRNLLELLAPDRVASFILAPNAAAGSTGLP